jgi:hypothetical protein
MAGSVRSRRDSSLSLSVLNCKFWTKGSAQQAVHQALQKDAILWTEPCELDPHALAGFDVSKIVETIAGLKASGMSAQ